MVIFRFGLIAFSFAYISTVNSLPGGKDIFGTPVVYYLGPALLLDNDQCLESLSISRMVGAGDAIFPFVHSRCYFER